MSSKNNALPGMLSPASLRVPLNTIFLNSSMPIFPPAQIHQRAYHRAYHIAEKTVGRNLKIPCRVGGPHPSCLRHMAERGLHVGTRLAESLEVLHTAKPLGRLVHQAKVELITQRTRIETLKGVLVCVYIIMVSPRRGRETCMLIGGNGLNAIDGNVLRENPIETVGQLPTIQ